MNAIPEMIEPADYDDPLPHPRATITIEAREYRHLYDLYFNLWKRLTAGKCLTTRDKKHYRQKIENTLRALDAFYNGSDTCGVVLGKNKKGQTKSPR